MKPQTCLLIRVLIVGFELECSNFSWQTKASSHKHSAICSTCGTVASLCRLAGQWERCAGVVLPKVCTYSLKKEFDKTERCLMAFHCPHVQTVSLPLLQRQTAPYLHFLKQSAEGIAKFGRSQQAISKVIKQEKGKAAIHRITSISGQESKTERVFCKALSLPWSQEGKRTLKRWCHNCYCIPEVHKMWVARDS